MKALLLVLVLAAAGFGAYHFYFRDHPISWMQGPEAGPVPGGPGSTSTAKRDFKDLDARLQNDMDRIPTDLHGARQMPTHALATKSQVAPYLKLHEEYATLIQACDLIIEADQAFAEHQQKCGLAPAPLGANVQERARVASAANSAGPAVYQQQQTIWDSQRRQSDTKVRQLLTTLDNKRL